MPLRNVVTEHNNRGHEYVGPAEYKENDVSGKLTVIKTKHLTETNTIKKLEKGSTYSTTEKRKEARTSLNKVGLTRRSRNSTPAPR